MSDQLPLDRLEDGNGNPISGGKAEIFEEGTTTPVTVFQDTALSVAHANPIIADSDGRFAQAFYGGTVGLKVVFKDAADVTVYTLDPAPLTSLSDANASDVSFNPITDVSSTNVQDAIAEVQGNISSTTSNAQTLVQTGGSGNVYTLTSAETIASYAVGQEFLVRLNHQNTGNVTLNVDALGAISVQYYEKSGLAQIRPGAWREGGIARVSYDGTRFIWLNPNSVILDLVFSGESELKIDIPAQYTGFTYRITSLNGSGTADNVRPKMQLGENGSGGAFVTSTSYRDEFFGVTAGTAAAGSSTASDAFLLGIIDSDTAWINSSISGEVLKMNTSSDRPNGFNKFTGLRQNGNREGLRRDLSIITSGEYNAARFFFEDDAGNAETADAGRIVIEGLI